MTIGILFVAVWFVGVAGYLLWQFVTNDLAPEVMPATVTVAADAPVHEVPVAGPVPSYSAPLLRPLPAGAP